MSKSPVAAAICLYLHPYYLLNALATLSYIFARTHFLANFDARYTRLKAPEEIMQWERNMAGTFVSVAVVKLFRYRSSAAYIADILFYLKILVAAAFFMMDIRMVIVYGIVLYALFLILPIPWYSGPDKVLYFTGNNFKETVEKSERNDYWLVMFYTTWSQDSAYLSKSVAEISLKYSSEHLHFGKVDAGQWPALAQEYRVDARSTSSQLPTFIMFQGGKPVGRLPHRPASSITNRTFFRKRDIIRVFDLDRKSRGP